MTGSTLRVALCALVGLFAGAVLGGLFAPDPTGTLAAALSVGTALVIGGGLYRSRWLREGAT